MQTLVQAGERGEHRRAIIKRLVMLLIAIAVVLGIVKWVKLHPHKKGEVTYETATVARGDVRSTVTATGVIQPWKSVDIKSDVAGRINKLYVDLGDHVKAGQLIMLIDPTDTLTAVAQAKANLNAADAKLQQADITVQQQKLQSAAQISSAQKNVEGALARLAQAKLNMQVQPSLTRLSISQAKAALASSQSGVTQAQQNAQQLVSQLNTLTQVTIPLNEQTVQSSVDEAKANLDTAQKDYDRQNQLLAQGYVAKSDVEAAASRLATAKATMSTSQQRLATLEQENKLSIGELNAHIDQANAATQDAITKVKAAKDQLAVAQANSVQINVQNQLYAAAKAAVAQSQADLRNAIAQDKQISIKQGDVASAQAQIVSNKAALQQANTNQGYTEIRAPRSGVITSKSVEEGTVVPSSRGSIGSTGSLLQIGDTSQMWAVCNVDETDIGQIAVGQKVTIKVDAYPSMLVDGKVIRIDPQATVVQNVTQIPVTVEISDPDERFKPQMNCTCDFIVDEADNVLTVPNEALKQGDNDAYTVQRMLHGVPHAVTVEVGLAGPDTTEIRSGLKEGDVVVTKTIEPEKPGAGASNPLSALGGGPGRPGGGRGGGGGRRGG